MLHAIAPGFAYDQRMEQLSGLDASFIYMEGPRTPMHIGAVYIIDAAHSPEFSYRTFVEHVRTRLPLVPLLRKSVVEVPLDLGRPFWINDADFDLSAHLPKVGCPRPGGAEDLMDLAARVFSRPLDRSRPLWEIMFVDGVDSVPGISPDSFALISRIHHAAVDGVSGTEVMGALLDFTDQPRPVDMDDPFSPERRPTAVEMVRKSYSGIGKRSLSFARFIGDVIKGGAHIAKTRVIERHDPPPRLFSAPSTIFNATVSTRRSFGGAEFELAAIKELRGKVEGATVNDVLLAICAGGLRRYLLRRERLPERPMVCMAPISVRSREEQGAMGNRVSAMLVDLATDEDDTLERLDRIRRCTRGAKRESAALPADRIMEFVPSETAALAARAYVRTRMADRHRPVFNLVITNVPGPPRPVYLAGGRVDGIYGTAPVFDGMGLILVLFSQGGRVSVGITACHAIMPDVRDFEQDLRDAFDELALEAPAEPPEIPEDLSELQQAMKRLDDTVNRIQQGLKG